MRYTYHLVRFTTLRWAAALLLVGCLPHTSQIAHDPPVQAAQNADPAWNHVARLFAGMPPLPGSPYASAVQSRAFKTHAAYMDRFWSAVESNSRAPIAAWRKEHLTKIDGKRLAVYPLSGADFVNLHLMFPEAPRYLMFALEDPGLPPRNVPADERSMGRVLGSLRAVIDTIASKNYFYSANMRTHLKHTPIQGTAPPLFAFLARLNMDIRSVERVVLDNQGSLVACTVGSCPQSAFPGMRYVFRAPGDNEDRELVYLSLKLQRDSLDRATPSGAYLSGLPPFNAIMKSAIYLLHEAPFAGAREWMTRSCRVLVQDDSGMPFSAYTGPDWQVRLFGRYITYTYSIGGIGFPPKQKDLVEWYRRGATPVRFRFGYGGLAGDQSSTLMVIERRETP